MRKLLLAASLILFGLSSYAQVPDVLRSPATPASGSNFNNRAQIDANLKALYSLSIPRAATFTLNGAKDSIGYVMFNTTSNRFGVYRGSGVWDTYTTTTDITTALSTALLKANNLSDVANVATALSNLNGVSLSGSYANPSWITSLAWSKITGTPTTLGGYGIADGVSLTGTQTLTNKTLSGASNIFTNIGNSSLVNNSVTYNGVNVALGGSGTITAATASNLTLSYGFTGQPLTFNGSAPIIGKIDSTVIQTVGNFFTLGNTKYYTKTQADGRYQLIGNYITGLTGDVTATGPGSVTAILATVNTNTGSFGTASNVSTYTVNGKGLITASANTPIQITEGQVTTLTTDLAARELLSNKTATASTSTTTYPNWFGVENYVTSVLPSTPNLQSVTNVGNTTTTAISAASFTVSATTNGGIFLPTQSGTPSNPSSGTHIVYTNAAGQFSVLGSNGNAFALSRANLTTSRIFAFPDSAGTFALENYTYSRTASDAKYQTFANLETALTNSITLYPSGSAVTSAINALTTGVSSVIGTTNRITVSPTSGIPQVDISASYVGQTSITTLGTIGTGIWQGTLVSPTFGGTGINNGAKTITLGGNLTTSGAFNTTLTATATTSVTLPTSGTLYGTAASSFSSANLSTSLSTKTGTAGNSVFSITPSLSGTGNQAIAVKMLAGSNMGTTGQSVGISFYESTGAVIVGGVKAVTQNANNVALGFSSYNNITSMKEQMRLLGTGPLVIGDTVAHTGALLDAIGTIGSTALTASRVVFTDANKVLTSTGIGTSSQVILGDGTLGTYTASPVTSFSSGNLSPLFTTTVATSTTTPALSFSLSNAAANTIFGNNTGSSATPAYNTSTTYSDAILNVSTTGLVKRTGTNAYGIATAGTDYSAGTSALSTGILKSTTTTGVLSIAVAADFPTLNQNTTGSAATLTTSRTLWGQSFDGSGNVSGALSNVTTINMSGALTVTTLSGGVGSINLPNNTYIAFKNAAGSATPNILYFDNNNQTFLGNSTVATPTTIYGSVVNIQKLFNIGQAYLGTLGVDSLLVKQSNGKVSLISPNAFLTQTAGDMRYGQLGANNTWTGINTQNINGTGNTTVILNSLTNTQVATSGSTQQWSPAQSFHGTAWNGTLSQTQDAKIYLKTTNVGSGNTQAQINFDYSVNGGSYTNKFVFDNLGNFTAGGLTTTNTIQWSANSIAQASLTIPKASIFGFLDSGTGNTAGISGPSGVASSFNLIMPNALPTSTQVLTVNTSGNIGYSPSPVSTLLTGQTGAATVTTITTDATGTNHVYRIGGTVNISTATTDVLNFQVTYTDDSNTSQTLTLGAPLATTGNLTSTPGTQTDYALQEVNIIVKANTTLTIKTILQTGGGSITYAVQGTYQELL